jgi:hypothetical protein
LRIELIANKFKTAAGLIIAVSIPVIALVTSALISVMYLDSNYEFCRVIAIAYSDYDSFQSKTLNVILWESVKSITFQVAISFFSVKLLSNKKFKNTVKILLMVSVIITSLISIDTYNQFMSEGRQCSFSLYNIF